MEEIDNKMPSAQKNFMSVGMRNWDLVAAYLAVCRTGSLSGAARALGLSQPTLRRQVEDLERLVGAALFLRSVSGLQPVPETGALMDEALAMEAAAEAFSRLAASQTGAPVGRVRISAPQVFAIEILPPLLVALRGDWPGLEFEVSVTNAVEDLLRKDADIAVRLVQPTQTALVVRKVAPVRLGFYAAPGPVAEAGQQMDYAALRDSGLMIGQDRLRSIDLALQQANLPPPDRCALRTDDDLAQLAAIRAGMGIGICQAGIARRDGLVPVCPELALDLPVWIAAHQDQIRLPRLRVVFDRLVAALSRL